VKFLTIKSPDAQVNAMKSGLIDKYPGLIRPGDVDELNEDCNEIIATPGGHFSYFVFNLRNYGGDTYGDPPTYDKRCLANSRFRQAVAYTTPKAILIGTIFKYIVVRVDTLIPPQMGIWHNPSIPIFDFNPGNPFTSNPGDPDACGALKLGGFYFQDRGTPSVVDSADFWSYDAVGDEPLGTIDFLSPSYEEAPTSFQVVNATVEEMHKIGLNNVEHLGVNFTDMLNIYVYPNMFDMFFLCWSGLSNDPDDLWAFFNSFNDLYQGRNHPGLHSATIDELTETIHNSLSLTEIQEAAFECQELLMDPAQSYGLSYIPIYSRNYYDAFRPGLEGILNMPLVGSDNEWTFLNMRWYDDVGPHGDNGFVCPSATDIMSLNPLTSAWADEVELPDGGTRGDKEVLSLVFDPLIGTNPYTLEDTSTGMASDYDMNEFEGSTPVGYVEGMKFTFNLKPNLKWQCGQAFTVDDIKFALDYVAEMQPPLWTNAWQDYVGTEIVDSDTVNVYYNKTSLWLKDTVSRVATLLPKHIWNDANRDGVEGDLVTDWQHFNLWEYDHPPVDGVVPKVPGTTKNMKCLEGTGAWVFEELNIAGGWAQVRANPNYYMTQAEVESALVDMFHWYGDVNSDGFADETDIDLIGLAWGSYPGHPNWDPRCDLNPDNFIDAEDARICGEAQGKRRTYDSTGTRVHVDPREIIGPPPKIGETFTVNINVSFVEDLYTWQAGMSFNASVLEALSIAEGEFLKRAGVPTLWTPGTIDNVVGEIGYSACSITGATPGVSGNGQLMNVTFKVKESGTSDLNLTDVLLLDSNLVEIPPAKESNGYVQINVQDIAILDVKTASPTTRYLYVNQYSGDYSGWGWEEAGTTPYLDAVGDGNYIYARYGPEVYFPDLGLPAVFPVIGKFGFQDLTLGPNDVIKSVTLEAYTRYDPGYDEAWDLDVYARNTTDTPPTTWIGSLWGTDQWSWHTVRWDTSLVSDHFPDIKTESGLNAWRVLYIMYWTADDYGHGTAYIDAIRLKVEIETTNVAEAYPTWIHPININVVVENQGTATETFDVTVYAGTNVIGTKSVTLDAGENTTVVFSWDLAGFPEGTYTISAEAEVLYGEIDTADNSLINGTVTIKHPGDADGDGILNAHDLGILAKAWDTAYGDSLYDPRADFNGDGKIDSQDHEILKAYWP
jgi:ABC-type transport system substrate-binding protein